jgi:hypothetical protein
MLFSEASTQNQETGAATVEAALLSRVLDGNGIPVGFGFRLEFLLSGIAGQTGTAAVKLNGQTLVPIAIADDAKVAIVLTVRRTSDTQGTVRGSIATDDALVAIEHAPVNNLAWTRNQSLHILATSDQLAGISLRDYSIER